VGKGDERVAVTAKLVPTNRLKPAPWNPRTIKTEHFRNLCKSIEADPEFMWRRPVLAKLDGTIYAGNMRFRGCVELGWEKIPAMVEDVTDEIAKARAIRDNIAAGEWENDGLSDILNELSQGGADLSTLGWGDGEIEKILHDTDGGQSRGEVLERLNITMDDPRHVVQEWDVWTVGEHVVICADVMEHWSYWAPYLEDGMLFAPYCGPFVPLARNPLSKPILMVQPDEYIAGHIIDQFQNVHGVTPERIAGIDTEQERDTSVAGDFGEP